MKKWRKLYCIDGKFTCPYCLNEYPIEQATRDHKHPHSRGGKTEPENIVACCSNCNSEKGALTVEEYELWKILEALRCGRLTKTKE